MSSRQSVLGVLLSLLLLGSPVMSFSTAAQNGSGISGNYDNELVVGVDEKSGLLTGYFETGTGWDESTKSPRFVCAFFLYGKLQGDAYQITTWYPNIPEETFKGQLSFKTANGTKKAHIKLEKLPGGCGMAYPSLAQAEGSDLDLLAPAKWTSVRAISAQRAFFHKAPNSRTKEKAYVVKNDAVRVLRIQNGWDEAEFDNGKVIRGWIKESDLLPPTPK